MDIESLYTVESHESGAEMQVKDDTGKELDMFITIAGIDSKLFRKVKNELRREILKDVDADTEGLRAKSLAEVTLGWRGFQSNGEDLEFSQEKAEQLYLNAPYLMDQADNFINQRINFTKG
jgi:hypothetical protein